jgi:hypothetical protein
MNMGEIEFRTTRGSYWKHTVTRQLPRQPKKLLLPKRKARQKTPKLGGALKQR